ncbi:MAG: hypothetical protein ABW185_09345 [Sedimenticola sp.]
MIFIFKEYRLSAMTEGEKESKKERGRSPIARCNSPLFRKKVLNHLRLMCNGRPAPSFCDTSLGQDAISVGAASTA